eukprot:539153-Hanusia_phi.AAC.1
MTRTVSTEGKGGGRGGAPCQYRVTVPVSPSLAPPRRRASFEAPPQRLRPRYPMGPAIGDGLRGRHH